MTDCKEDEKLKVLDHCVLTREKAIKREIYNRGPVVAPLFLKSDYLVYGNGVYSPADEGGRDPDFLYGPDGRSIMHAVSVLGWGRSQGTPYWLVRHAWGSGWGENGYARVSMDTIVHESYIIAATPGTEANLQIAEQKKAAAEKRKEEAKEERAARDARIAENRKKYEAEKAAEKSAEGGGDESLDDLDDEDFEAEVDLDADEAAEKPAA